MKHKIKVLCFAMVMALSVIVGSVSAFAASPAYSTSVKGNDSLSVPSQDACEKIIISTDASGLLTHEFLNSGFLWAEYEDRKVITATQRDSDDGFGFQFWYDEDGVLTCDMYSGSKITRLAGKGNIYSSSTSESPAPGGADLGEIITDVSTGVGGVFSMSKSGFDFLTGNDLCMFMIAISFAGVGLGLIGRAFKTSRK